MRGFEAKQPAADHHRIAAAFGSRQHLVDVVEVAERHHARQVAARNRDDERVGAGGDQQPVVRLDPPGTADHRLPLAVDVIDGIACDQLDTVRGVPLGGIEDDFVEALLSGQDRRKHDAVVVHPRLGAEDRDRVARGVTRQDFLDRAAPGHAVADHHQSLGSSDPHKACRSVHDA